MHGKTIQGIVQEIQSATNISSYEYLPKLALFEEWEQIDRTLLLNCYIELFNFYYDQRKITEAVYYFTLSKTLITHYGDCTSNTYFMRNAVKKSVFAAIKPDTKSFIENIIPISLMENNFELLSNGYLALSHIHLSEGNVDCSLQEAKIAYHFAKKVAEADNYSCLCNAQVQLLRIAIEMRARGDIDKYIEEFGWKTELCKNNREQFFVSFLNAILELLDGQMDEGIQHYLELFPRLLDEVEIIYAVLFAKQMRTVLKQVENNLTPSVYIDILSKCEEIIKKYNVVLSDVEAMFTENKDLRLIEQELEDNTNIFLKGQELFNQLESGKKSIICFIAHTNLLALPNALKYDYLIQFKKIEHFITREHYFISQYNSEICLLVALIQSEQVDSLKKAVLKENLEPPVIYTLLSKGKKMGIENFHQLFSYTYNNCRPLQKV